MQPQPRPAAARPVRRRGLGAFGPRDPGLAGWSGPRLGSGRGSGAEAHVDLLGLGEAGDHALQGPLPADAALLVAAVGLADDLSAALVDLHPAGLEPVGGGDRV